MKEDKLISVLMGVYNSEKTLINAVRSIQAQTYSHWELICCDDGSTDGTYSILMSLASEDKRIHVIRNDCNYGLGYALNRCFEMARGDYIARMDADDESCPERFEKELTYLETGECEIVSTALMFFNDEEELNTTRTIPYPTQEDFFYGVPVAHPACMMRRECLERVGGYREDRKSLRVEDADLWFRLCAAGYCFYNIDEPLYRYRFDLPAVQRQKMKYRINASRVRWEGHRLLCLPIWCLPYCCMPVLAGLIPPRIRYYLHKQKRRKAKNTDR